MHRRKIFAILGYTKNSYRDFVIYNRRKMWQNAIYQNLNLSRKRYHWENKKAVCEKEQKPRMWTEWAHFLILGKSSTPKKGGCRNSSQAYRGAVSVKVTVEGKLNHDDTSTQALSLGPSGWLCQELGREEWCDRGWHATQHGHVWKHWLLGFHPFKGRIQGPVEPHVYSFS